MDIKDLGRVAVGDQALPPSAPEPSGLRPSGNDPSRDDEIDFYDDRDEHAEWCDRCQGTGSVDCHCGGDLCFCANGGEMDCPQCHGEGEWSPTPAQIAARIETAKWMRELWDRLDASAIEARRAATGTGAVHESAARQGDAQSTPGTPNPHRGPHMNNDMISLAERCEAAAGGDRELDRAIRDAVFQPCMNNGAEYTASIDAAMTLVPDGWDWAVGTGRKQHMTENGKRPWAWCAPGQNFAMPQDLPLAATPALALCAASLRARALSTVSRGESDG